ncbi:hypothetical protein L2E82_44455 [Cichorium intybus]|uniref:Uncharacterized protein n=1 Tax=Cichorium intybus TaxID=13427 RepID=A0ACB8ZQD2_CICIN|nr:hypothetical protein L2E82_44455 [Cichorium intybus]
MGRAKVHMEPINDIKKRKFTFHKRKDALIKKAYQLKTLCDIKVSMIICSDYQEPQIFPSDPPEFNALIDLYKQQRNMDPGKIRYFGLSEYFNERKTKIEDELTKAKKKNLEAKYPTWFDFLSSSSEVQLREFALGLGVKIDLVKRKIESLKIPKIQNLDHYAFYPGTLLDVQSSFVTPSINPSPLPMMFPMNYNNLVFNPAELYADQNNSTMQSTNPNSEIKLPTNVNATPIPSDGVSEDSTGRFYPLHDCYEFENFSLDPLSPTFWLPPEISELPPFMYLNNPVSTAELSSQTMEYKAGTDGVDDYHYLVN